MRFQITPILLFIPVLAIQLTVVPLIEIDGVVPDFILILLVYYAVLNGHIPGMVLGFIFGFLFDIISGSLIGSSMLAYVISGFTAGYFSNESKRDLYIKSYVFPLIVLLCGTISSVIGVFFSAAELNANLLLVFFRQGILPGFYSAILSVMIVIFYPKRSFN